MIDIKQFFSLNSINEKNRWFQSVASESDFNSFESKDIWGMLDICFTLFKINFENNNYSEYEYIANVCEKLLNLYFKKNYIDKNNDHIDFIIDIVCFVYELTYKYEEKAEILLKIIESKNVDYQIKLRAIECALEMSQYSNLFDDAQIRDFKTRCHGDG